MVGILESLPRLTLTDPAILQACESELVPVRAAVGDAQRGEHAVVHDGQRGEQRRGNRQPPGGEPALPRRGSQGEQRQHRRHAPAAQPQVAAVEEVRTSAARGQLLAVIPQGVGDVSHGLRIIVRSVPLSGVRFYNAPKVQGAAQSWS